MCSSDLVWHKNEDIAVLRNGKAKKNDPPIPEDWAPISGSGQKPREEETPEEPAFLDPIRFRYSTESVVTEQPEQPRQEAPQEQSRSRSRRRNRKPRDGEQPKTAQQEQKPKQERKQRQEGAEPEAKANKPHRRRPNYRHRKPKPTGQTEG